MRVGSAINWIKKKHDIFLQSPHQVDMKNVVECQKEFFAYFNALETRGVVAFLRSCMIHKY